MARAVERQVVLPWAQVVRIAMKSLMVRFFRSLITTAALALAVAFVAYTWVGYDILNAMWPACGETVQQRIMACGFEMQEGLFGSTAKDRWLVILSLVVCVVGTVNAQLMAVTERFREIGTFKCLGALNSFVVRIFVLEAVYQGFLGGAAGALLGALTSSLALLVRLGWDVLLRFPVLSVLATIAEATLLSILLSFLGVLYPALVAARMQPAVALRSDQ